MDIYPEDNTDERSHRELVDFIQASGEPFQLLTHQPCHTSVESAAARASAGAPGSVGAKALIVRTSEPISFMMAVIPGDHRLNNKRLVSLIGRFRFATQEEIKEVTAGLRPGMIPPFAQPVFPGLLRLVVDTMIPGLELIGFNAAHFQKSIVMSGKTYIRLVPTAEIAEISTSNIE